MPLLRGGVRAQVGVRGPVKRLLENAAMALVCNTTLLAFLAAFPFTLGRLIISILSAAVAVVPSCVRFLVPSPALAAVAAPACSLVSAVEAYWELPPAHRCVSVLGRFQRFH
jgi:hypothetical protein